MIQTLTTENEFNKLFKSASKGEKNLMFLFLSPDYDRTSRELRRYLMRGNYKQRNKLYIVNSFITPHAFAAYRTTKVPTLVSIIEKRRTLETYLPFIYNSLGVAAQ